MPTATELIRDDHREVEALFARFEESGEPAIAEKICAELTAHTECEEQLVYPSLKRLDFRLEQEGEREHEEAKRLIEQIEGCLDDPWSLRHLMGKLKAAVMHHVEEEEREALPKLDATMGAEMERIGPRFEERKRQLLGQSTSLPAGTGNLLDLTKEELLTKAREADIKGRSKMTKKELAEALGR